MKRISTVDRYVDKFGAGKDGFADENLITGIGGTVVDDTWADHVQEEIARVIEGAGFVLDALVYDQLEQAIIKRDAAVALAARRDADLICSSTWRRGGTGLPASDINGLAHNGARTWVAVGASGVILSSEDQGETWTTRTPGSSYAGNFRAVRFGEGVFVAVGAGGEIQTSPDGVTWTRRATSAADLYGVAYDGTGWAAVGIIAATGYVMTATTATSTWTARTAPTSTTSLYAVASDGAGRFVAVGNRTSTTRGQISVSDDHGVTWTSDQAESDIGDLRAIAHSGGVWYAGGEGGNIIASDSPTGGSPAGDWRTVRHSSSSAVYAIVAPGDGHIVAARGIGGGNPADPITGHVSLPLTLVGDAVAALRITRSPTESAGRCAHYGGDGLIMVGLYGGGIMRSLVYGHRLAVL